MADKAVAKNTDDAVPTDKKLDDLYDLIDGIEIAMLTTRRADGHLVSRPMQTQERDDRRGSLVHDEHRDAQAR